MKLDMIKKLVTKNIMLLEAAKINFAGYSFILKVDVNEDPQKKGIKIQFIPVKFGGISKTEQNDIAIELEKRIEKGLAEYDLKVERDRNLKDKTIIGFFIYIEYFDRIVRQVLSNQNPKDRDALEYTKNKKIVTK